MTIAFVEAKALSNIIFLGSPICQILVEEVSIVIKELGRSKETVESHKSLN